MVALVSLALVYPFKIIRSGSMAALAFCFLHRAQSKFYACVDAPWLARVHVHNQTSSVWPVLSSERNECSLRPTSPNWSDPSSWSI